MMKICLTTSLCVGGVLSTQVLSPPLNPCDAGSVVAGIDAVYADLEVLSAAVLAGTASTVGPDIANKVNAAVAVLEAHKKPGSHQNLEAHADLSAIIVDAQKIAANLYCVPFDQIAHVYQRFKRG